MGLKIKREFRSYSLESLVRDSSRIYRQVITGNLCTKDITERDYEILELTS